MIRSKQLNKPVLIGILGLFLLSVLIFLSTFSFIKITPESDADIYINAVKNESENTTPRKLKTGLNIIPVGNYTLSIGSGISLTEKSFNARAFQFKTIKPSIHPQQYVKKIARGAGECVFGNKNNMTQGIIYSYDCYEPTSFFINKYEEFSKKNIIIDKEETSVVATAPYQDGLIGLGSGEGGNNLVYIDQNKLTIYPLSEYFESENEIKSYKLAVEGEYIYILDTSEKTLVKLKGPSGSVIKTKFVTEDDFSTKVTSIKVLNDRLYLYTILESNSANNNINNNADSFEQGILYIFENGSKEPTKSIKTNRGMDDLSEITIINDSLIAGTSIKQSTTVYDISRSKFTTKYKNFNSSRAIGSNGELYTLSNGQVFKYSPENNENILVFGSSNIHITQIQDINSVIILNGYSNHESEPINQTYILDSKKLNSDQEFREEDQLPYGDVQLPISWMDYYDNNIFIAVSLNSLRKDLSSLNNGFTYNQEEYNKNVLDITEKLNKDGFSAPKYNIKFSPY